MARLEGLTSRNRDGGAPVPRSVCCGERPAFRRPEQNEGDRLEQDRKEHVAGEHVDIGQERRLFRHGSPDQSDGAMVPERRTARA